MSKSELSDIMSLVLNDNTPLNQAEYLLLSAPDIPKFPIVHSTLAWSGHITVINLHTISPAAHHRGCSDMADGAMMSWADVSKPRVMFITDLVTRAETGGNSFRG